MFRFWKQGAHQYRKVLVAERRERLLGLKSRMSACTSGVEKDAIRAEINAVKLEYRDKFRAIRQSRFSTE
jgi:hypothetical protein